MKLNTIVYYHAGAYGTFLEWCLNYFSDESLSEELPFTKKGNSHKFDGNLLLSEKMFLDIKTGPCKFARTHPGSTTAENLKLLRTPKHPIECYRSELKWLEQVANNIIVLYFDSTNILWGYNNLIKSFISKNHNLSNYYEKNNFLDYTLAVCDTLREKITIDLTHAGQTQYKQWGKNSFDEMEIWEFREFLSLYLHGHWLDMYGSENFNLLVKEFPHVTFIKISELKNNFTATILKIFNKIDLKVVRTNFDEIHAAWEKLQIYSNRDNEIKEIVNSVIDGADYHWNDLSIVDEAEIQKQLRDHGFEIKCNGINNFPNNTKTLTAILIKN